MFFSLEVRRAKKGDCLLLHYGKAVEPAAAPDGRYASGLAIIDGGPAGVYGPHLKPRILELRKSRKLDDAKRLEVDLLMVSHVDDDHIQGILDLTGEMIDAEENHVTPLIQVLDFWHNSFDAIIGKKPEELTAAISTQFPTASAARELPNDATLEDELFDERPEEEVIVDTLKVLASVEQGYKLRLRAEHFDFQNIEFGEKLIIAKEGGEVLDMDKDLTFTVVGPMQPELVKLQAMHDKWLKKLRDEGKSPPEALAAYIDKSVPNLSSIVVLAQVGDKSMLLTGDARGDKVLEGLQLVGKLGAGNDSKTTVDVLKVPHHGSAANLDDDFFERILAKHYVFSGDGEHGNPEREALEMLLNARGEHEEFTIHLTYPIVEIDQEREKDWNKERNKQKKRKQKNPNVKVRPAWSPDDHSLAALFDAHPKFHDKVKVVDKQKPHIIDLLDPVDF